jgi:hypothetical protein
MTTERDPRTRIVLSWLREETQENAERVLLRALDEVDTTPQRRSGWPAWRTNRMNKLMTYGLGAAAVVVALAIGTRVLGPSAPGDVGSASSASPSPTLAPSRSPSPSATPEPTASLVTHALEPFGPDGFDEEDPRAASITFTFDAPASWETFEELGVSIGGNDWPDGAYLGFYRGGALFSDPCLTEEEAEADADVPVGPTVNDFVTALVEHPSLDVTAPADVTLSGYSGKYLDLLVPDDISECFRYKPMDEHIYAQGAGQRWHMWILDVDGVRVLVETNDYPGTSADWLAEAQAIVDGLVITP